MTLFRDISVIWAMMNIAVFFHIMMEFRYSFRRCAIYSALFFIPLSAFNVWYLLMFGPARMAQSIFFILLLPSVVFYFVLSKYRDGRFLYSFFLICDLNADLTICTYLIDLMLPGQRYLWMLLSRLVLFPLLNIIAYKFLRKPYLRVQHSVERGWFGFAAMAALFEVVTLLLFSYPSMIEERLRDLPALMIAVFLSIITNWHIFIALENQQALHEIREHEELLRLETQQLEKQVEQTERMEQRIAIERHDLRHRFRVLSSMLEDKDYDTAIKYLESSDEAVLKVGLERQCRNNVLNAVLSYYFGVAASEGIRVDAELDIPADLSVDAMELSTVFANALENAIEAVKGLADDKKVIKCRCINRPQLMIRISNPYEGEINWDEDGIPVSLKGQHGIGSRSIAAYCEKHGAWCDYKTEDNWFTMQITQQ